MFLQEERRKHDEKEYRRRLEMERRDRGEFVDITKTVDVKKQKLETEIANPCAFQKAQLR